MANIQEAFLEALLAVTLVALSLSSGAAAQGLAVGFYDTTCPTVETIIRSSMRSSIANDSTVAPGVLRLAFHDCFVRGCDASVLLDTTDSEKKAAINVNLHGFEAIDDAKAAVEEACPGVVSCADILQYAARDAVNLTGGESWDVFGGRRDGLTSSSLDPPQELPSQTMTVPQLLSSFATRNLNAAQMVALSGSHTLGVAHCQFVTNRLYPTADPSLPSDMLKSLESLCPSAAATPQLDLDEVTPGAFDSTYFENLISGRGVLTSDQELMNDATTSGEVTLNAGSAFGGNFGRAMVVMARYEVLVGSAGQIRKNCRQVN